MIDHKADGTVVQRELDGNEKFDDLIFKYPHVVGWDRGKKISNGKTTDIESFRVFVDKKVPKDKLKKSEVILSTIDNLPTDVIQTGEFSAPPAEKPGLITKVKDAVTHSVRKLTRRPFDMGTSGGNISGPTGTVGYKFRKDGSYDVLFSNGHVFGEDIRKDVSAQERRIVQAGPIDDGSDESHIVGSMVGLIKLSESYPAFNDAAISDIIKPENATTVLHELGTPVGVRTIQVGDTVYKSGRTTGVTNGTILSLTATIRVKYSAVVDGKVVYYYITHKNCILTSPMSSGGDSGSIGVIKEDGKLYIWGYLFADSTEHTVWHEIQNVMSVFSLSLIDEEQPSDAIYVRVTLTRKKGIKDVHFTVVDISNIPVCDAQILLGGEYIKTNTNGKATFLSVPDNKYTFEIVHGDYEQYNGTVIVQ